jgi:hypothetical protein
MFILIIRANNCSNQKNILKEECGLVKALHPTAYYMTDFGFWGIEIWIFVKKPHARSKKD